MTKYNGSGGDVVIPNGVTSISIKNPTLQLGNLFCVDSYDEETGSHNHECTSFSCNTVTINGYPNSTAQKFAEDIQEHYRINSVTSGNRGTITFQFVILEDEISLSLDKDSLTFDEIGQSQELKAIVIPADKDSQVTWSTSNDTENDVMGKGLPLYPIERCFLGTGERFEDSSHILYVNGAYRGDGEKERHSDHHGKSKRRQRQKKFH